MRKFLFFLLCMTVFLSGCGKKDPEVLFYQETIELLESKTKFASGSHFFETDLSFSKVSEEEIQYRFVLDQVKEPIRNVVALLIHDQKSEDVFPSVGIFDEKVHLEVGKSPKGVILVGYLPFLGEVTDFHAEFRLYLSYTLEDGTFFEEVYQYKK